MDISEIEALTFDVFGTVGDWRSSIIRDLGKLSESHNLSMDAEQFALDWRAGYAPAMHRVRTGELPWAKIDDLHMMILEGLLKKYSITNLSADEIVDLNRVWHRLDPWPDVIEGLTRMRRKYILAALSNGNVSLLTRMAKYAGLPWDCVLSAELSRHYKPDPEVYRTSAEFLSLPPERVMMVAAHAGDLAGARSAGLRTAFVFRPQEYGGIDTADSAGDPDADIAAEDFLDLAEQLAV